MKSWVILFTILLLIFLCQAQEDANTQRRNRRRNREQRDSGKNSGRRNTNARIHSLEEKLAQSLAEISDLHSQMKSLNDRMAAIGDQRSPGYQAPQDGARLRNFPACPNRAFGFHYVAQFRKCYHLAPRELLVNWTDGAAYCKGRNQKAHLVSIETAHEQEFLQKTWQIERGIASFSRFWTSGRMEGGNWKWEATNRPLAYQFWIPTTEHNDNRFNCMATFSSEAYNWGDVACWSENMVTCELDV